MVAGDSIDKHVTVLSIIYFIYSAIFLFVAALVFLVIAGAGLISGDQTAVWVTGTIGTALAVFFLILALPGLVCGWGLTRRLPWARVLAIILGILNLFNFPLGTIVGIYTLWVLFQPEAERIFSPQRAHYRSNAHETEECCMARKYFLSQSPYENQFGFARAMRVGYTVYVSGTAPIADDGSTAAPGDPAGQARQCFEIIKRSLEEAGGVLDEVVRTRMYITDPANAEAVGKVHNEFFGDTRPAATMVVVNQLMRDDWLVEIECDCVTKE